MITLRDIEVKDAQLIYTWKCDPLIKKLALDYDYSTTLEEQLQDIQFSLHDPDQEYKIIILDNSLSIGYIRINWMDSHKKKAWLRFGLGAERGHGYSRIALNMYIKCLKEFGCLRIEAEVYRNNSASQKILESLGFLKEGIKRKAHFDGTQYIDIYAYGLLIDEKDDN
jgi:RimJ/RimL family protein N-acetyltransferase